MSITQELVKELFDYRDGQLYWKNKASNRRAAGEIAGSIGVNGYRVITINYKKYKTHRLIFLMFHGYLPELLDHVDNNRLNNRIDNLRVATFSQNMHNSKVYKNSKSGIKGVSWEKDRDKWKVQVMFNGKNIIVRNLEDLELAQLVAQELRNKYHKEFAKHG